MIEDLDSVRERAIVLSEQLTDLRSEIIGQRSLVLSVVACIFLPLTVLTGLLGMNVGGIPYHDSPYAFRLRLRALRGDRCWSLVGDEEDGLVLMRIRDFAIAIEDARLEDLSRRLDATRWPDALAAESWDEGASPSFMRRLLEHWRHGFDWRAREAELNRMPQFVAEIEGFDVHFVHRQGVGPAPLPLIMTHGWPGSFVEMEHILPLLADPGAHGGDPRDAFHVVVPSLPGYGFSSAPAKPGTSARQIGGLWAKLMAGLGYERYGAQGGDIGAAVSAWLARDTPASLVGVHLNYIPGSYRPALGPGQPPVAPEEQAHLDRYAAWFMAEGAYAHMQGTKPQTAAFALNDSPAGLAAWLVEKFRAWSDCGGNVETVFSLDTLLTDISIYWFSGTIEAALRLYLENRLQPLHFEAGERVDLPLGVAHFAHELPTPPRSWVERSFNVRRWTEIAEGGHFAALEQPVRLAEEIRAFFRPLR